MSDSMRAFADEMKQYGIEEGTLETKRDTAKRLFAMDNSVDKISTALDVDVKQVEDWLGLARA